MWNVSLIFILLFYLPAFQTWADGGYFSSQSVAVSADQRAIIIKNGNEISMTFSTGYTGEGEDFGWIIPTPVPPAVEDISEAGEEGETAFEILDGFTAPEIYKSSGCFPSGTDMLTTGGTRAIETVEPGTEVYSYDLATGEWIFKRVLKRLSHQCEGDMIGIQIGNITIQATGTILSMFCAASGLIQGLYLKMFQKMNRERLSMDDGWKPAISKKVTC